MKTNFIFETITSVADRRGTVSTPIHIEAIALARAYDEFRLRWMVKQFTSNWAEYRLSASRMINTILAAIAPVDLLPLAYVDAAGQLDREAPIPKGIGGSIQSPGDTVDVKSENHAASALGSEGSRPLIRLVYISTAREILSTASLGEILRVSRANNAACDVTGLLVVGGRRFLQALEGPASSVDATFERIKRDPRHFATVILSREEVDERQFGMWAMGHQATSVSGGVAAGVEYLIGQIVDQTVRAQFEQFAIQHAA